MKTLTASINRLGNRSVNQDRCLIIRHDEKILLAVADGMGGHTRGELAAQTAIESFQRSFEKLPGVIDDPLTFLQDAIQKAQTDIVLAGDKEVPTVDSRTVCVVCIVQGNHAWWGHIGDSRLYCLRFDQVTTRTRDHTPLETLLANGEISEDRLRTHPLRNSVSRCLGGIQKTPPKASFDHAALKNGDMILLCSDGLWSALPEKKLCSLNAAASLDIALTKLGEDAEHESYPNSDNISAVSLRWFDGATVMDDPAKNASDNTRASNGDPLQTAIDEIHRALIDYSDEMDA
ncbi:MAG: protein phosphatase 2C domain-containing protein [Gammaproteobacteria bacterium]